MESPWSFESTDIWAPESLTQLIWAWVCQTIPRPTVLPVAKAMRTVNEFS